MRAVAVAVALGAFTKLFGVVFLGSPRSDAAAHAHEAGPAMRGPILVLASLVAVAGLLSPFLVPGVDAAIRAWVAPAVPPGSVEALAHPVPPLASVVPFGTAAAWGAAFLVLAGLVVQDPYRMGYDGVKTALAVSKGEKVEAFVDTGANLVTKDNMADPKIDALLNPKVN